MMYKTSKTRFGMNSTQFRSFLRDCGCGGLSKSWDIIFNKVTRRHHSDAADRSSRADVEREIVLCDFVEAVVRIADEMYRSVRSTLVQVETFM